MAHRHTPSCTLYVNTGERKKNISFVEFGNETGPFAFGTGGSPAETDLL